MNTAIRVMCFTILVSAFSSRAAAEDFTDAIGAYLQQCIETEKINGCIVVGIAEENGSRVVSYGKLDDGTDRQADGDTVFCLHSMTGTFTYLLLQDMVDRGQMKLDDPVAKYLPESVRMPTRNGKEITLGHLATEISGLPDFRDQFNPQYAENPLADFTVEKMYAFVSGCQLTCDPGTKHFHGGVDKGLLGQAIALRARADFESLLVERICRPLGMDSTRFTLTPEMKSRLAAEHNPFGYAIPNKDWGALMPLAGLHSTANDLLKFIAALDLTPTGLTPLLEKNPSSFPTTEGGIVYTAGGRFGGRSFACYDKTRRRGVVLLSTSADLRRDMGDFLLNSEWQSDRRPTATVINTHAYDSVVGQYRPSPDLASRMAGLRRFLQNAPKALIIVAADVVLAVPVVLLWRAAGRRKRWIILGCAVLVSGLWAGLIVWLSSHPAAVPAESGIGIRRQGDRLFAQATGESSGPMDVFLPPIAGELLPQSQTRFFERLSGRPLSFSRDARGKVTGLTMDYRGKAFSYEKISDLPPAVPQRPKLRVAVKLDTKLLDACVGRYEFVPTVPPSPAGTLTIWRQGDRLLGRVSGENALKGAFDIYPESETNFFLKLDGSQLSFIKNDKGQVLSVIHHSSHAGVPDAELKKLNE